MSLTKIEPAVRTMLFDLAQHPKDPKKFQCAGCREWFARPALQVDHIVPEVESTPEMRSDPTNLQLLCAPKGTTFLTSCHKAKTRREHQDRARRNRPPRHLKGPAFLTSCAVAVGGFGWYDIVQSDAEQAQNWVTMIGAAYALGFTTYLVQKGWRRRRPRKVIPAEVIPDDAPRLDTDRIVAAARESMGARGIITAQGDLDSFVLRYPDTGFSDHEDDKRFEVLERIQAKIGDRWKPTWDTRGDRVRFDRRPELSRMIRHPGLAPERPWNIIPIGPGVHFDLLNTPHILIIGTTGAGKTALMRTIIAAVADSARRDDSTTMLLADPKQIEMPGFRGWPGVKDVISDTEDLWDMAFEIEQEMNDRLALVKSGKAKSSDFKKLIVVIDEYEQFFKRMDRHWKSAVDEETGKPLKKGGARVPPPIDAIQSVLSMARRVNIHLIIGTQSPDANWFGGTGTRENMSGRAAVGPLDAIRARMMFDDSSVGRDIPIEFKGRATVQVGNGAPEEVQTYYTPDPFDPDGTNTEQDWAVLKMLEAT